MNRDNRSVAGQSTRQRILKAALEEFAKFGKAGARVDRIATQAKINKAMIYYHFNSKENLYYASLMDHIGQFASELQERVSGEKTLREIFEKLVEQYILIFSRSSFFKQILLRELAEEDSPIISKIAEVISQSGVPNILYNKLLSETESGRIRKLDIRQTIASLISVNIGFFVISPIVLEIMNVVDSEKFIAARKEAVVDLILNGVLIK